MAVHFSGFIPDQVKDSKARQHCEKVETNAPHLLGIITQTASTSIDASIAQLFFKRFNPIAGRVRDLQACLFNKAERDWLAGEVKSMLTYLEEVQDMCKQKLGDTKVTRNRLDDEAKRLEEKGYKCPALGESKTISIKRAAALDEKDLTTLSSTLSSLHTTKSELKGLEQEAKEVFAELKAWKEAVEQGKSFDAPPSFALFNELFEKVQTLSIGELSMPEGLLAKVAYCSKVAGRALQDIATNGKQLNSQLTEAKEKLISQFEAYEWENAFCEIWRGTGKLPSPTEFVAELKRHVQPDSLLEAVNWLNGQELAQSKAAMLKTEVSTFHALVTESTACQIALKEEVIELRYDKELLEKKNAEMAAQLSEQKEQAEALTKKNGKLEAKIIALSAQVEQIYSFYEGPSVGEPENKQLS